jgi:hypothetical protein
VCLCARHADISHAFKEVDGVQVLRLEVSLPKAALEMGEELPPPLVDGLRKHVRSLCSA